MFLDCTGFLKIRPKTLSRTFFKELKVKLPVASHGASLAQLDFKLRRPLREVSMMFYILPNHITSHTVSNWARKIPVFPQLPKPQLLSQPRELAEYTPRTLTLDDSHYFPNGQLWRKRYQNVDMINRYFHLDDTKTIFLTDLLYQLSRSFPKILALKNFLPVFRTPYQMVTRIVDRITRSLDCHDCFISYPAARAYADKGLSSAPPYNPQEKHAFIPAASRGVFCKELS